MSVIDLATYSYNLVIDDKGFTQGMGNAEKQADNFKSKMSNMGDYLKTGFVAGVAGVGAAIGATIVTGVKATAELDQLMSQLKSSTGATTEETEKLKKLNQELFKVNTDSYEDLMKTSEAMMKTMKMSVDQIEEYQQGYMDFAKTTGQANDSVINSIAGIGKAWGLTAEENAASLDMLKLSNEKFGTDIVAIQNALQDVAPAAKTLSMSFEEANGYLNLFTDAGLDAGQATVAFQAAAKKVKSPEEFKKMLEDIQNIKDPTERTAKSIEVFGAKAGVAMANALDGSRSLDDFLITMEEAEGTVANASAAFDSNFNVQLELTKKLFSGLVQELGEKFMPAITEALTWVTNNVPIVVDTIEQAIDIIGKVMSPVIKIIKDLTSNFSLMGDSSNENFTSIKETITSVIANVQDILQKFTEVALILWDAWGDKLVSIFEILWNTVTTVLKNVTGILSGLLDTLIGLLTGDWQKMGDGLKKIWSNLWEGIGAILSGAWNILSIYFSALKEKISSWFTGLVDSAKQWGKDIIQGLVDGISGMFNSVKESVGKIASGIKDTITSFFQIRSPSRVTREQGKNIAEGWAIGLEEGSKSIEDAMKSITDILSEQKETHLDYLHRGHEQRVKQLEQSLKSVEESYDRQIQQQQEKLKMLDQQYQKEDRIKRLLDIDTEIESVKADKRFEFIDEHGNKIITYNRAKVAELEKQRDELKSQFEREDIKQAISNEVDRLQKAKDEKVQILRAELDAVKEKNKQEIEEAKKRWDGLIKAAQDGTLTHDELMNGWYASATNDLKGYVDGVEAQMARLRQIYANMPSPSSGGGGSSSSSSSGGAGTYIERTSGGGVITYSPNGNVSYDFRDSTYHDGGLVGGGDNPSWLRSMFNLKPDELLAKLQIGEAVLSRATVDKLYQLSNQLNSGFSAGTKQQPQPQAMKQGDTVYHFHNLSVQANDGEQFFRSLQQTLNSYKRATRA